MTSQSIGAQVGPQRSERAHCGAGLGFRSYDNLTTKQQTATIYTFKPAVAFEDFPAKCEHRDQKSDAESQASGKPSGGVKNKDGLKCSLT